MFLKFFMQALVMISNKCVSVLVQTLFPRIGTNIIFAKCMYALLKVFVAVNSKQTQVFFPLQKEKPNKTVLSVLQTT